MISGPTFKVKKHFRLGEPFGSKGFNRLFDPALAELQRLWGKKKIHTEPQRVMLVLDEMNAANWIPAANYNKLCAVVSKDDCRIIDRLLQTTGVVEASVVFEGDSAFDAGLTPGIYYTHEELTDQIYKPKNSLSLDLADPAVYAARVPGETLYDLVDMPKFYRGALARLLQIVGETDANRDRQAENVMALELYGNRDSKDRIQDAKTLAALVFTYASDSYIEVRARARQLTVNYSLLFNKPEETKSLMALRNYLSSAAEKTAAEDIIQLTERISKAAKYREEHRERNQMKDDEKFYRIVGIDRSVDKKNKK